MEEAGEENKKVYFWSDSECVIKQIRDRKSRFETYVANRLSKIHADSEVEEWHYVPTKQNPADFTSRGMKPKETEKWDMFHHGPEFLRRKENLWGLKQMPNNLSVVSIGIT